MFEKICAANPESWRFGGSLCAERFVKIAGAVEIIPRSIVSDLPDRIIAATGLHLNLPLVSKDHKIQSLQSIHPIW